MSKYLKELTTVVEGNRQDLVGMVEDVHELSSPIGLPPSAGPISLWAGHLEVKSDIGDLTASLKGKADGAVVGHINQVESRVLAAEQQLTSLEAECDLAFRMVRDELSRVTAVTPAALGNANPAVTNPTLLADVERKVSVLENIVNSLSSNDAANKMSVRVGSYYFQSLEDVGAWIDTHLPANFPFGAFCDVYSFLERVKAPRDVGESHSVLSDMETRKKISLSADEANAFEAQVTPVQQCKHGFRALKQRKLG